MKVNDDIRRASTAIIGSAAEPEEKLKKLYDYCVKNIHRIDGDDDELSPSARAVLKPNKSPADTLMRKQGTGRDIDFLFAAFASAVAKPDQVAERGPCCIPQARGMGTAV